MRGARGAITAAAIALLPVIALGGALGVVDVPLATALDVIGGWFGGTPPEPSPDVIILTEVRFPRVLLLCLVGGALAISGAALQATFQNPMAAPSILGVTGGGALGAVFAVYTGLVQTVSFALPASAFAGALLASALVYVLSHVGGRPTTSSLLLTGVAVMSLMTASISLILTWSREHDVMEVLFWMMGGTEGRSWREVRLAVGPIAVGAVLLVSRHRFVDALAMGEEHALSVGLPVHRARVQLLALCALTSGTAVSVCGAIGFVGLMVPHLVRLVVGPRARVLLPACFLFGAEFLVVCDLLARIASGHQVVHVGIVTAFLGVPFFLWLLYRSRGGVGAR